MRVSKIGILNNKKMILFISVIFLASFCLLIPTSLGYGYGFTDAELKLNGTYYETLDYYDGYAYYRVNCREGDDLYVTVEVNYPSYDINLDLYDETEYLEDWSYLSGDFDYVSATAYYTTHYYIVVVRVTPSTGTISFTLTIEGATGLVIPGFEIISLLIGVI